jgi:manganese/zinc/iron transport system permease protein
MEDLIRLITLQDANTRTVLLGVSLLGLAAGVIGAFAVLRRRSLLGDALAHAALPGLCAAYFVVGDRNLPAFLLGALLFGILGILTVNFIRSRTRVKEDAAIGLVLSTFFGLGIVLSRIIQNQPSGNRAGLDSYILGRAATMIQQDVLLIGGVALLGVVLVALLFKEFRLLCFDPLFAAAQGWPVHLLDLLLMAMICICTVVGMPAVGVVLISALLIIPAAAARFWTDRLAILLLIAGAVGMSSGVVGTAISALAPKFPAGPPIVLVAAGLFLASLLVAPRRGLLAAARRAWALRRRTAMQNLLRALFEIGESAGDFAAPISHDRLLARRAWRRLVLRRTIHRAAARGLVTTHAERCTLTAAGLEEARRIIRTHRIWEQFLIAHADIAPDHVDRDADEIEHVLPRDLIARLEEELRLSGRYPAAVPASPHRVGEDSA